MKASKRPRHFVSCRPVQLRRFDSDTRQFLFTGALKLMTPQEKKDAYKAKEAARRAALEASRPKPPRFRRRFNETEDGLVLWAKRYDDLNGRPDSPDDY